MLGTWRWNVGLGIVGAVLTVAFSIGNNPLSVMLLRSVYAFTAFFVLAFVVRAVLAYILQPPSLVGEQTEQDEGKGLQFDVQTPDETEDLNELLKSQLQDGASTASAQEQSKEANTFKPLSPPHLISTQKKQPEELAQAIRHLTGE